MPAEEKWDAHQEKSSSNIVEGTVNMKCPGRDPPGGYPVGGNGPSKLAKTESGGQESGTW